MKRFFALIVSVLAISGLLFSCGGGGGGSTPASSAKAITAFSFTSPAATGIIDENAKSISITVPYGTNVTALVATFTTTGVSVKIGSSVQGSGSTPNDFTNLIAYTVTAADNSTATYIVTVTIAPSSAKAITTFSFGSPAATGTIDENAKTILVTVPYGTNVTALVATFITTGASVKVGTTVQVSGSTSNDFTSPVAYTVTAADNSTGTYIVTVTVAPSSAKSITAFSLLGISGTINESAKTISVTVPYGTNVTALVATFTMTGVSVKVDTTVQVSGSTPNDFTSPIAYTVTAADNSTATYTVTVDIAANPAKAITAFSFTSPAATGVIDENAKSITVTVPYGTNVTALIATFTTTGASVKVGTTVQVSGSTPNDFTNPIAYTVTAADNSTATYTITVNVALPSSTKALTGFSFASPAATGAIDENAKTISVTVPYGTNVTTLIATFTTTGASVMIGSTIQVSGITQNDFTNPLLYTVTAEDSSTVTYTVTVTVASTYTPHSVGSIWTYIVTLSSGGSYTQTKTIPQSTASDWIVKYEYGNSSMYDLQSVNDTNGEAMSADAYYNNADNSLAYTYSYSPPMLLVPSDLTPGNTALSTSTWTYSSGGSNSTGTITRSISVDSVESVTVPAGTFTCVKITTAITRTPSGGSPSQTMETRWYAQNIGWVKIISYPAVTPSDTTTRELASFNVLP